MCKRMVVRIWRGNLLVSMGMVQYVRMNPTVMGLLRRMRMRLKRGKINLRRISTPLRYLLSKKPM